MTGLHRRSLWLHGQTVLPPPWGHETPEPSGECPLAQAASRIWMSAGHLLLGSSSYQDNCCSGQTLLPFLYHPVWSLSRALGNRLRICRVFFGIYWEDRVFLPWPLAVTELTNLLKLKCLRVPGTKCVWVSSATLFTSFFFFTDYFSVPRDRSHNTKKFCGEKYCGMHKRCKNVNWRLETRCWTICFRKTLKIYLKCKAHLDQSCK